MSMIRQIGYDFNQRPFLVIWETTRACDLACKHCRAEANQHHDPYAMSFADGCRLIDQIDDFGPPHPLFIMTGGDPFKRADIFDLVAYATQKRLMPALSPSGTPLLTRQNLQKFKDAGGHVISLSIDGSNPGIHDEFRQAPGSFDWTVNGWREAISLGIKLQINTTVTRYNLTDLPEIFRLVREIGAMTWSVFFLVPTGRALAEDQISAADCEAVMNFLYDASKYIGIKTTEGHHYKRIVLQRSVLEAKGADPHQYMQLNGTYGMLMEGLRRVTGGEPPPSERMRRKPLHVNSAQGFVFISLYGDVFPSGYLPLNAGNILKTPLKDIYRNSPLFQALRADAALKGRCGLCEYRPICGGSRSRAYGVTGDVLAEEPFCLYEPNSFPFAEEVRALITREEK